MARRRLIDGEIYGIGDVDRAYAPEPPAQNIDAIREALNQSLIAAGYDPANLPQAAPAAPGPVSYTPPAPVAAPEPVYTPEPTPAAAPPTYAETRAALDRAFIASGYDPNNLPRAANQVEYPTAPPESFVPGPAVEPRLQTDYTVTPGWVMDRPNTQGIPVGRMIDSSAAQAASPPPMLDIQKAIATENYSPETGSNFTPAPPLPLMPTVRGPDVAALAAIAARAGIAAPPPAAPVEAMTYDYSGGPGIYSQEARGFRNGGPVMLRGIYPDDMPAFAEGGLVDAAEQVRGAGRFGDDYLVHIQPEELDELRQMYGEPTINPETGLPEFFLGIKLGKVGKFLKAAVRVGATIAGAAVGGPAGAALGAGISTKLTGGSWKESLGSAALAGIGSYVSAPSGGLTGKGTVLSKALAGTKVGGALGVPAASSLTTAIPQGAAPSLSQAAHSGSTFARGAAQGAAMNAAGVVNPVAPSLVSSGLSAAASALSKPGSLALIGGAGLVSAAAPSAPKSSVFTSGIGGGEYTLDVGPYDRGPVTGPIDYANYGRTGGEHQFFAAVNPNPVITQVPVPVAPAKKKKAAGGPITGLGAFASGGAAGYIDAPGGGQDDRETILVSGGEYVVDADVVSALGDGNNAEGAARLDRMRENIRRQKRRAPVNKIPPKAKAPEAYMRAS